ncbi:Ran-binding protein like [Actinidia chinensis var. chinensis]|uniref:Ran-binding protein like n=1 Tax=Actinidia chinensis var. chinensis TaxID=1590841 RepID=A0A2R6R392_ACTCC|nr:Ran-binding protein like [Actinidia chinensis var. chinensis]
MEWWHKMTGPLRRFWIVVAKPLRIRKTGLVKLHHEVRTCEYEDVRVLWEMLKRNETELKTKRKLVWSKSGICDWARPAPYLCRSF